MIRKPCDNCQTLLEFEPETAGQRVRCPHCGDINVVPAQDRAVARGLPPDSGPEQDVLHVRPSMWRAHPFLTLLTLGIATFVLWLGRLGDHVRITNKRTILRRGFLARSTTEVMHDDIRNIQIAQTFMNRILNVGTIGISSAGQDGIEIVADAVPGPNRVKEIIDCYRPM